MSQENPHALALAEAALEIARRRAAVVDRLRDALLAEDSAKVLRLARVLTGLEEGDGGEGDAR